MIATWMFATMALTVALGGAALALERALRLTGRQGRGPWAVALVASFSWPVIAPLLAPSVVQSASVRVFAAGANAAASLPDAPSGAMTVWLAFLASLDRPLFIAWIVASALLLVRVIWALAALRRVAHRAPQSVIDDTTVRITDGVGPAVFALWRAQLLLPDWLLELDPPLRRLVMAHEREHVRSRDAQLVVATFLLVALMPWNAPLWWLARRLRIASELDCDVRVLRAGADARTYGQLLLLIAQRQGNARFLPMMAGAPSTLRARIIAMSTPLPTRPARLAAVYSIFALALVGASAHPVLARSLASVRLAPVPAFAPQGARPAQASPAAPLTPMAEIPQGVTPAKAKRPAKNAADTLAAKAAKDSAALKPAQAFKEFTLDEQVTPMSGMPAPRYPQILLRAGITGTTQVMFVVDTTGMVIESTLKVVRTAHQLFVDAVKATLPDLRFHPARVGNRPVKQLVQMVYRFASISKPELDSVQVSPNIRTFDVTITGNDKAPAESAGKGYQMVVHGANATTTFEPLYFVDGKRTEATEAKKIARERIASVEVFKGETARAKYGDEGKNGVIVITTKP